MWQKGGRCPRKSDIEKHLTLEKTLELFYSIESSVDKYWKGPKEHENSLRHVNDACPVLWIMWREKEGKHCSNYSW